MMRYTHGWASVRCEHSGLGSALIRPTRASRNPAFVQEPTRNHRSLSNREALRVFQELRAARRRPETADVLRDLFVCIAILVSCMTRAVVIGSDIGTRVT